MLIDTNAIVTATEANQNFSRVAKLAEKKGHVYVFKNNKPKLLVIDLDTEPQVLLSFHSSPAFTKRESLPSYKRFSISSIKIFRALIRAYFLSLDSRTYQGAVVVLVFWSISLMASS